MLAPLERAIRAQTVVGPAYLLTAHGKPFASPEALVAFSLGMTLFVVTLALNVLALYIVRKYREQYE